MDEREFKTLIDYLEKVPAVQKQYLLVKDGFGWVKFSLDIEHPLAWHVVQEFGHVMNFLSIDERLPTVFYPVSPPPYMNGGPHDFLSWVKK